VGSYYHPEINHNTWKSPGNNFSQNPKTLISMNIAELIAIADIQIVSILLGIA